MQISRKLIVVMAVALVVVAVVVWCGPSTGQADGPSPAAPEKALEQTPDEQGAATVANANVASTAIRVLVPSIGMDAGYSRGRGRYSGGRGGIMGGVASRRGNVHGPLSGTYVPELAEAVRHADPGVRDQAIMALMALRSRAKDAVPALIDELRARSHPDELRAVVETLGCIGPGAKEAVPVLKAIFNATNDDQLREIVSWALGNIRSPASGASEDDEAER